MQKQFNDAEENFNKVATQKDEQALKDLKKSERSRSRSNWRNKKNAPISGIALINNQKK